MNNTNVEFLAFLIQQAADECCLPQPQFKTAILASGMGLHSVFSAIIPINPPIVSELYILENPTEDFEEEDTTAGFQWVNVSRGKTLHRIHITNLIDKFQELKDSK